MDPHTLLAQMTALSEHLNTVTEQLRLLNIKHQYNPASPTKDSDHDAQMHGNNVSIGGARVAPHIDQHTAEIAAELYRLTTLRLGDCEQLFPYFVKPESELDGEEGDEPMRKRQRKL